MNIAHVWTWIVAWVGGLTLAGIGAGVKWFWSIRKLSAEIEKIQIEIAALKKADAVKDAALILRNRASILLQVTNTPALLRYEWASYLPDSSIVDAALAELGATRMPGTEDRWMIDIRTKLRGRS